MPEYYCDERKFVLHATNFRLDDRTDKSPKQTVTVSQGVSGVRVRPDKQWSPLCEKLFRKEKASCVILGGPWSDGAPKLDFIRDLPECKDLTVSYFKPVDFSPLAGNPHLERLQIFYEGEGDPGTLDLTSLPNLRQCQIPAHRNFFSALKCSKLVSLGLSGGTYKEILDLTELAALEEFICGGVSKIPGVMFSPKARLRALDLCRLKLFESMTPMKSVVEELRDVTLDKLPRLKIDWLADAKKVECIALRVGEIPSINFLAGLKKLQVLDLFGSKVMDKDFSVRAALPQKLDAKLWGTGVLIV
ncbi:MAG: hypothetical protein K0Q55_3744 [Verrucomicrobia bacterium]|jgi:hypothetical protein|nr:hypothetical protein [Verrucomicrobiota bacterium]